MMFKILVLVCLVALPSNGRLITDLPAPFRSRIVGGENATKGEFPHLITIRVLFPTFVKLTCGGSILNEYWILTAAHCELGVVTYVYAGKYRIHGNEETQQVLSVKRTYTHEKYNPGDLSHDIRLLKLYSPIKFNKFVQPIKLPEKNSQVDGDVVLAGWGLISSEGNTYPEVLQKATLPVIDYDTCKKAMAKFPSSVPIHESNVCTGPLIGGIAGCDGDFGGPIIKAKKDGESKVVGIASWTQKPCGIVGSPTVFTKVSPYIDWIEYTMEKN